MLPEHLSGLAQLASSGRGLTSAAAAGSIGRPVGAGGGHRAEGCKQVGHTSGIAGGVRPGVRRVRPGHSRVQAA